MQCGDWDRFQKVRTSFGHVTIFSIAEVNYLHWLPHHNQSHYFEPNEGFFPSPENLSGNVGQPADPKFTILTTQKYKELESNGTSPVVATLSRAQREKALRLMAMNTE